MFFESAFYSKVNDDYREAVKMVENQPSTCCCPCVTISKNIIIIALAALAFLPTFWMGCAGSKIVYTKLTHCLIKIPEFPQT